ncbi:MAG TPA: NAD(P)-dependent oxidoreductase [Terriglobia bacterium]|nr:NAD(P)-dependent oxidoreductase [Terriglobia bacterium]
MAKQRVAMMGLGLMGAGMAGRLLSAGFPLTVYNRSAEKAAPFAKAGAKVVGSPRQAAANSDVVISMVADDAASRSVWLGEKGALAGAAPGTVVIESGTLTVGWIKELAAAAAQRGCELLDAPVTGTKPHAASGELRFLVGGAAAALEKARPVLTALGNDIVHLGPTGSGALMKLINNFMCGAQLASLAEGVALIGAGGLDRDKALAVLTSGAPGSPLVKSASSRATSGDPTINFFLRLMAKDITYAMAEGAERGVPMQTAASALVVFQHAIDSGRGDKDLSAIIGSISV